jgi:hypothetical protein
MSINIDELVDINSVSINPNLSKHEKIAEYNRQISDSSSRCVLLA